MRLVGIWIMALSLIGGGFIWAEKGKERLRLLLRLEQMIRYLKSQMLYSHAPLPEAVQEVGNHFGSMEGRADDWGPVSFFQNVGNALSEKGGPTFLDIWQREVSNIPASVPLNQSDRQNLRALGNHLGYADREMQEQSLLFYLEQLEETVKCAREEAESLGKLYRTLGVAAGMFWMVLLI